MQKESARLERSLRVLSETCNDIIIKSHVNPDQFFLPIKGHRFNKQLVDMLQRLRIVPADDLRNQS